MTTPPSTIVKQHCRAAVVVPGIVLFEGGAGKIIRRRLLKECDLYTLMRLPEPGILAREIAEELGEEE